MHKDDIEPNTILQNHTNALTNMRNDLIDVETKNEIQSSQPLSKMLLKNEASHGSQDTQDSPTKQQQTTNANSNTTPAV